MEYITSSGSGHGLIYNGKDIIPFVDEFPRNTKLYDAMTTKADERVKANEKAKADEEVQYDSNY